MPSPKSQRRGGTEEKNRKGRLAEKAMSFSGLSGGSSAAVLLQRPRTFPPKLTKLLLNVTIQRSTGALQVLIPPDSTVEDLIAAALRQYVKEGRRPVLASTNARDYGLHYSQFSLESLDRTEKLAALGSRNFFLCPKMAETVQTTSSPSSSCSNEVDKPTKSIGLSWFKFTL
nr:uncharacterized protein LOC109171581 [Ipomoea batatas]GMD24147.1 uncharacterized protein LOC109171581 [Ipomoea batatas]